MSAREPREISGEGRRSEPVDGELTEPVPPAGTRLVRVVYTDSKTVVAYRILAMGDCAEDFSVTVGEL